MLQALCLVMAVKTLKHLLFATPVSRGFLFFEWTENDLDFSFLLGFSPIVLFSYACYFHPQKGRFTLPAKLLGCLQPVLNWGETIQVYVRILGGGGQIAVVRFRIQKFCLETKKI